MAIKNATLSPLHPTSEHRSTIGHLARWPSRVFGRTPCAGTSRSSAPVRGEEEEYRTADVYVRVADVLTCAACSMSVSCRLPLLQPWAACKLTPGPGKPCCLREGLSGRLPTTMATATATTMATATTIVTENSVSGSHMLRIECFSATKGLGLGKFIKSSPFIVGGHTWAIRYYPDGRD
ncbi:hypothetical protein HU200_048960 [Digitaria exilis]|uniref:MATH domain-containing protein n=1 Tax=Digitaria exilis TaxID=1010633 RepID=A0A835B0A1_9POAL|nr:hypothetical protein HU200_048960 [Digitaria exilis]